MNNNSFFNRRIIRTVATAIIVGLIALFGFAGGDSSNPISKIANDITGLAGRIIGAPSKLLGGAADSIGQLFSNFSENQKLRSKIDGLTNDHVKLQALEDENKALKETLDLKDSLTDYQLVTAQTITRSPTTFNSQITINQGSNSGIKENQMVLAGKGVIGRVSQVSNTSAKVALISDDSSSSDHFSVEIRTQSGEIISGIISGFDKNTRRLIMNQLSSDANIENGDIIMTSGKGGVVPLGLFVGNVDAVSEDNYGMSKEIFIKPAGNLNNPSTVLVATKVGAEMEPENN